MKNRCIAGGFCFVYSETFFLIISFIFFTLSFDWVLKQIDGGNENKIF